MNPKPYSSYDRRNWKTQKKSYYDLDAHKKLIAGLNGRSNLPERSIERCLERDPDLLP